MDAAYLREMWLQRDEVPSFDAYPFHLPAVRGLGTLAFHPKVTFFVGENGSGKSTLLEAIAVATDMNAEGGGRNFRFATKETHSPLERHLRIARSIHAPRDTFFLRAESFYNLASEVDRLDADEPGSMLRAYGGRSLHEQSHGESFFALFQERFRGRGLYLLDEPEAALSPQRQLSFLTILHRLCGANAQFVIATHSPIILAYPDAWIYSFDGETVARVPYEETEHYRVARTFLDNPARMLSILLDVDGD